MQCSNARAGNREMTIPHGSGTNDEDARKTANFESKGLAAWDWCQSPSLLGCWNFDFMVQGPRVTFCRFSCHFLRWSGERTDHRSSGFNELARPPGTPHQSRHNLGTGVGDEKYIAQT